MIAAAQQSAHPTSGLRHPFQATFRTGKSQFFTGVKMTMEIIRLNESNIGLLNHYDKDIFDENIDPERLAALLKEQNHILLVAVMEGLVIGQVLAVIHQHPDKPSELYIDDLAVSETFQRRGIATRLLERLYLIGVEKGCKEIWVGTEPENTPANKFYNSLNLSVRKAMIFEGFLPGKI